MNAILDGFRRLADFSGRTSRGDFWSYAVVVVVLSFVGLALAMIPAMKSIFAEASAVAAANPEAATVVSGPGHYSVEIHDAAFMPDMTLFFAVMRIGVAIVVVLLAAAVTRRLHDTGRRGFWGLMPVIFLGVALTLFPTVMSQMLDEQASLAPFFLLFANNIVYLLSLAGLVFLLAKDGDKAVNRYGPAPV